MTLLVGILLGCALGAAGAVAALLARRTPPAPLGPLEPAADPIAPLADQIARLADEQRHAHDETLSRLLETNRALLEQERVRAGSELDGKKSLIDQQLVTMTGELDKVTELVRQLDGGQRKAYGELSNELRRQHEGIAALSRAHPAAPRGAGELEGARPVGRAHGRRRAAARGPARGRQLPQAGDARQRRPARLHVPVAQRSRDAHGREVPARQLRAPPRSRRTTSSASSSAISSCATCATG